MAKTTVLLNVNHAPWKQGDFLRQKAEALSLALQTVSANDEWFGQYVENMCWDQDLPLDTDPKILFDEIINCDSFSRAGTYVPHLQCRVALGPALS